MYERNPHTKCMREIPIQNVGEINPHTKCMRPSILYGKMKVGGALPSAILPCYPFILLPPRPELLEVEVLQYPGTGTERMSSR
jgi:hypothetical protein